MQSEKDYVQMLESAVLAAEQWMSDPATATRKGYQKKPVYQAADAVRARRSEAPIE